MIREAGAEGGCGKACGDLLRRSGCEGTYSFCQATSLFQSSLSALLLYM